MARLSIRALAAVGIASCAMAGCSTSAPQQVNVVADSFCVAAKKKTWSIDDTPDTIEQIRRYNAGVDRACGVPGKVKTS